MGARCISEVVDSTKKKNNLLCHHAVITTFTGDKSNYQVFSFDTEKEDAGISYVTGSKMQTDDKGRTFFPVVGAFSHKDGKVADIIRAEGLCSTNIKVDGVIAVCIAETKDGRSFKSLLANK
jgi:hypothetical protein